MNGPTPRMPLAPKVATVFSGVPGQIVVEGVVPPTLAAPITCTLTAAAFSPETGIARSALLTEPQLEPSANCRHSASGLPSAAPVSVTAGRVIVSAEEI